MKEIGLPFGIVKKIINEFDIGRNNSKITTYRLKQIINYFSFKKLEEVLNKYIINLSEIKLLPSFDIDRWDIKDDDDDNLNNYLWAINSRLKCMGDIHVSNEAACREYISIILLTAINYFNNILVYS